MGSAGDNIITVYERAMAQVWLRLEGIAQQHGVADALQMLIRVSAKCYSLLLPCFSLCQLLGSAPHA